MSKQRSLLLFVVILLTVSPCLAEHPLSSKLVPISKGWAQNSINAVIFRHNSITSYNKVQYVAFYDENTKVVLAKRELDSDRWHIKKTQYQGNTKDAHNSISIMIDGEGYLHMAWDHHNSPLTYCKSTEPGSLELTEKLSMTGYHEDKVTYPEFYRLPTGNLVFFYRDGGSGRGNMVVNHYNTKQQKWSQLHDNLISGEGERNAYWQAAVDAKGTIHISWVWREGSDVATNHDICYANSSDEGKTWKQSNGKTYPLPITVQNSEYAIRIPQNSGLMNQTSMSTDQNTRPYIASYWRPENSDIPQYHVVYHDGMQWKVKQVSDRKAPFNLKGVGTKKVPISRPQILTLPEVDEVHVIVVFRDAERNNVISLAKCEQFPQKNCFIDDLTSHPVGQWEPTYDIDLWTQSQILNLFVQKVGQGDRETLEELNSQMASILEWTP